MSINTFRNIYRESETPCYRSQTLISWERNKKTIGYETNVSPNPIPHMMQSWTWELQLLYRWFSCEALCHDDFKTSEWEDTRQSRMSSHKRIHSEGFLHPASMYRKSSVTQDAGGVKCIQAFYINIPYNIVYVYVYIYIYIYTFIILFSSLNNNEFFRTLAQRTDLWFVPRRPYLRDQALLAFAKRV